MQDTSSNAMTEVALGLSMAFFSLLILVLISIGLDPESSTSSTDSATPKTVSLSNLSVDTNDSLLIAKESLETPQSDSLSEQPNEKAPSTEKPPQQLFFVYQGIWHNANGEALSSLASENIDVKLPVYIGVEGSLSLERVVDLRSSFSSDQVFISQMPDEWETYFAEVKSKQIGSDRR